MRSMYAIAYETMVGIKRVYYNELSDAIHAYMSLKNNSRNPSLYRV